MNHSRFSGAGWELSVGSLIHRAFSEHLVCASLMGNNYEEEMFFSFKGHSAGAGKTALQVKELGTKPNDLSLIQNPHSGRRELSPTNCPSTCIHKLNVIKSLTRSTGVMEECVGWQRKGLI